MYPRKAINKTLLVVALITASILFGGGYVGYIAYEDNKNIKMQINELQNIAISQQSTLMQTRQELFTLAEETGNTLRLEQFIREQATAQLGNLINETKKDQQDLENQISQVAAGDISSVIAVWEPRVASVVCTFANGAFSSGSGTVIQLDGNRVWVLTNKHIVDSPNGALVGCTVDVLDSIFDTYIPSSQIAVSAKGYDWAAITIVNPPRFMLMVKAEQKDVCKSTPAIGDEIVVLGYPSIGDRNRVTATEGIVSGYDNEYIITSAKVEQGNSGGAAIQLKNNCLLGIPTFVQLGQVESLARILDMRTIIGE